MTTMRTWDVESMELHRQWYRVDAVTAEEAAFLVARKGLGSAFGDTEYVGMAQGHEGWLVLPHVDAITSEEVERATAPTTPARATSVPPEVRTFMLAMLAELQDKGEVVVIADDIASALDRHYLGAKDRIFGTEP